NVLAMFSEMGVNVVETEEASEEGEEAREEADEEGESEGGDLVEVQQKVPAKAEAKEPTERTDDPVRMYLREMSPVKLLSREGECAIAKRIEAGREAMDCARARSPSRPSSFGATSSTRAKSSCATSSTSKRPMPVPMPRPCRRR